MIINFSYQIMVIAIILFFLSFSLSLSFLAAKLSFESARANKIICLNNVARLYTNSLKIL